MPKNNRGGKRGAVQGGGSTGNPSQSADLSTNAQSVHDLAEFLHRNYGARMDESKLSKMDYKTLWTQVEGIEEVYKAFPELKPLMKSDNASVNRIRISGEQSASNTYASMNMTGNLNIGNAIRKHRDIASLMKGYENDVSGGFHPKGTNASHISSHEVGHMMVMLVKNAEGGGFTGKYWGSDTAKSIVHNAWNSPEMKQIRKQYKAKHGRQLSIKEAQRHISGYGATNHHETVAEAVAQFSAIGNNSPTFTRAIVNELRTRMISATSTNNSKRAMVP